MTRRKENPAWSWSLDYELSSFMEHIDHLPLIKEIVPKTLSLLEKRFPEYKGSDTAKLLNEYEKVILRKTLLMMMSKNLKHVFRN